MTIPAIEGAVESGTVTISLKAWEDMKSRIDEIDRKAFIMKEMLNEACRIKEQYNKPSNDWEKGSSHAASMILKVWQQALNSKP